MSPTPVTPLTRNQKLGWFLAGFAGWFVVNGALGALALAPLAIGNSLAAEAAGLLSTLLMLANLAALIALAFFPRGRWVALGILSALAVVLCIVLLLGATVAAICFSAYGSGNL